MLSREEGAARFKQYGKAGDLPYDNTNPTARPLKSNSVPRSTLPKYNSLGLGYSGENSTQRSQTSYGYSEPRPRKSKKLNFMGLSGSKKFKGISSLF